MTYERSYPVCTKEPVRERAPRAGATGGCGRMGSMCCVEGGGRLRAAGAPFKNLAATLTMSARRWVRPELTLESAFLMV